MKSEMIDESLMMGTLIIPNLLPIDIDIKTL